MTRLAHWLAIVEPRQSWLTLDGADRQRLLSCGIVGVSVRAGRPGWLDVARDVTAAGLKLHLEAWAGEMNRRPPVDAADGALFGAWLAARVRESGADAARTNAERDVWGLPGDKKLVNSHALAYLDACADTFHAAGDGLLQYLGFASPRWHYGSAAPRIPESHRTRYQATATSPAVHVMAYQNGEKAIRVTLERAAQEWPGVELGAYAGVGRLDDDGRAVGSERAWRAVCANPSPLSLSSVTWYVGLDQTAGGDTDPRNPRTMLLRGHRGHAPLVDLIPAILSQPG